MIYPRLFLARNLLRNDGVIFVSIDDNEVHNLRMIMNEIFGEESFVGIFPWRKRTAKSDVPFGVSQDYEWIICYAKEKFLAGLAHERKYYHTEDFPNDGWRLSDLTKQTSAGERPNSAFDMVNPKTGKIYPFNPKRVWAVSKDTFSGYYEKGKIVFPDDYDFLKISIPAYRVFESEDKAKALKKYGSEEMIKAVSTHFQKDIGMSEDGNKEMVDLFGGKLFSFPKPSSLIKYLIQTATEDDDIVLDFFAGSGTTAHAVMELNMEDDGNRHCISIQLPEIIDESSEAYEAGYKTIADISRERIRRAGQKIREANPGKDIDTGFRAFRLSSSCFKQWQTITYSVEDLEQQMIDFIDTTLPEADDEDRLFELLIKSGYDPHVAIDKQDGYYSIAGGELVVVLGTIDQTMSRKILSEKPTKVISLDTSFGGNDVLKTNILIEAEGMGVEWKVI